MNVESPLLREVRELRLLARGLSRVETFPSDLLDLMVEKIDHLEALITGAQPSESTDLASIDHSTPADEPTPVGESAPLTDSTHRLEQIRVSLTLNDRFLFQRELFGNDAQRMAAFFEALSQRQNLAEAASLLHAYCPDCEETEGYTLMRTLLERWYPAHVGLA